MSIKDKFRSLWENIVFKRGPEEIVARKTYYTTNAFSAFCIGFVLGIVVFILQGTMDREAGDLTITILLYTILALSVASNIWYLLPLFRSDEALWIKIVRPILGVVLFAALLYIGVYAFILLLLACCIYVALKIAWWSWTHSHSSSSSSSTPHDYDVLLDNGTKLKQTDFGGHEFKGNDGHTYTQEYGCYHRNDE